MKLFKNYIVEDFETPSKITNGHTMHKQWNEGGAKHLSDSHGKDGSIHELKAPMTLSSAKTHGDSFSYDNRSVDHGVPVLKHFDRAGKHTVKKGLTIPAGSKVVVDHKHDHIYASHPVHGFISAKWKHADDNSTTQLHSERQEQWLKDYHAAKAAKEKS